MTYRYEDFLTDQSWLDEWDDAPTLVDSPSERITVEMPAYRLDLLTALTSEE